MSKSSRRVETFSAWLIRHRASVESIRFFWEPVVWSALAETLDHVAFSAVQTVMRQGICSGKEGLASWIPERPLREIYHDHAIQELRKRGIDVRLSCRVDRLTPNAQHQIQLTVDQRILPPRDTTKTDASQPNKEAFSREMETFDGIVLASDWQTAHHLLGPLIENRSKFLTPVFFPSQAVSRSDSASNAPSVSSPIARTRGFFHATAPSIHAAASPSNKKSHSISPLPSWEEGAITAIHLWFDRPILSQRAAVLLNGPGQWIFRPERAPKKFNTSHEPKESQKSKTSQEWAYHQVLISASHRLISPVSAPLFSRPSSSGNRQKNADYNDNLGSVNDSTRSFQRESPGTPPSCNDDLPENSKERATLITAFPRSEKEGNDALIEAVCRQLCQTFSEAQQARLRHVLVTTTPNAVLSPTPARWENVVEITPLPEPIVLAGDWTVSQFPSTMEAAVRSGQNAAAKIQSFF